MGLENLFWKGKKTLCKMENISVSNIFSVSINVFGRKLCAKGRIYWLAIIFSVSINVFGRNLCVKGRKCSIPAFSLFPMFSQVFLLSDVESLHRVVKG